MSDIISENMEIFEEFVSESREMLSEVESNLMEIERLRMRDGSLDRESLDAVFRAFHSVKGTGGFLALDNLVAVTHVAESLLDLIRTDRTELTAGHITLLCEALDFCNEAFTIIEREFSDASVKGRAEELCEVLGEALTECLSDSGAKSSPEPAAAPEPEAVVQLQAPAQEEPFPAVVQLQPPAEDTAFPAVVQLQPPADEAPFPAVVQLQPMPEAPPMLDLDAPLPPAVDPSEALKATVDAQASPEPAESKVVPMPQKGGFGGGGGPGDGDGGSDEPKSDEPKKRRSIRVDVEKLDQLMTLVGELILAENMVTHNEDLDGLELDSFNKAAMNLNRITRSLQDIAMAVRMVPIRGTFRKMLRLVRDLARKQDKEIDLVIVGEDTEVDKNLIEAISDPLVHIIRNAVDHGIQLGDDRVAQGKSATGRILLEARHQAGEVRIVIQDDGRGLGKERIINKAIERGLIFSAEGMTDAEIYDLIFQPGFSTAEKVTDVSGRGVGMDVVRRNIERLNGRVEVMSKSGEGTTFTLRIPLTLAIIDGMLVRVGAAHFTIPLLNIKESVPISASDITTLPSGQQLICIRGSMLPLTRLSDVYQVAGADLANKRDEGIVVIVEQENKLFCLLVDELVGQRQTVIKALPGYLGHLKGLSGCSILSNGDISLIVDLNMLAKIHRLAA